MPSFATPGPISATIDVPVGDIRIIAGDARRHHHRRAPQDDSDEEDVEVAQRTRVEYGDEQLLVKAPSCARGRRRSAAGRST